MITVTHNGKPILINIDSIVEIEAGEEEDKESFTDYAPSWIKTTHSNRGYEESVTEVESKIIEARIARKEKPSKVGVRI